MISGETYEELYEILGQMDKLTVMKIPEDILNNINSKRNKDFKKYLKLRERGTTT